MSLSIRTLAVSAAFALAGTAFAATAAPAPAAKAPAAQKEMTAQQQRMADCNKEATGKKGAERKTFMSSCLKGESTAAAPAAAAAAPSAKETQQERMKSCNAEAKTKAPKGDAHKAFMSACLKGESPAAAPAGH